MFKNITPQKVKHIQLGYIVQSAGRDHVEYLEEEKMVRVEVDTGITTGIYRDSIKDWVTSGGAVAMTSSEVDEVLSRVESGLQFMGSKTEIC